jgi:hypothetical protein
MMKPTETDSRLQTEAPQGNEWKRLNIKLNAPTARALDELTETKHLSATEIIRRAIGTWHFLQRAADRGARLQVVEKSGEVTEVLIV